MALSATVRTYIGVSTTVFNYTPTWTEVTSYVRSIDIDRGRQDPTRAFNAGSASIVLNNRGRMFDPNYASSLFYGYFQYRLQVKIEATYGGTTYSLYRGWTNGFPQSYPEDGSDATVTLDCTDLTGLLSSVEISQDLSLPINQKYGEIFIRFGEGDTNQFHDFSGNNYALNTFTWAVETTYIEDVPSLVPSSSRNGSRIYIAAGGSAETYYSFSATSITRNHGMWAWIKTNTFATAQPIMRASGTAFWTLYLNANGTLGFPYFPTGAISGSINVADDQPHFIATYLDETNSKVSIWVDGKLDIEVSASSGYSSTKRFGVYLVSDGTNSIAVQDAGYTSSVVDQTVVTDIYNAGLLAARQTPAERIKMIMTSNKFDPSSWVDVSGSWASTCYQYNIDNQNLIDALQTVADTEYGYLFTSKEGKLVLLERYFNYNRSFATSVQATFSDQGNIKYNNLDFDYSFDRIINEATIVAGDGSQSYSADNTSIDKYFRKSYNVSTLAELAENTQSLADAIVAMNKDVVLDASAFTVKPETNASWYSTLLPLDIGYKVQLVRKPLGIGSNITVNGYIQSIRHRITPADWSMEFYAAATNTLGLFILDTSSLDGIDILGY